MRSLTISSNRGTYIGGVETSASSQGLMGLQKLARGGAHHPERHVVVAYVRSPNAHVQGASLKALGHVLWRGFSSGHQRDLKRLPSAPIDNQRSNVMDTVHAARKAAPDYSAFYTHPIDRISEAQSQIKSLALLLDYALEKDNEHKDGLTFTHLANCLGAIASLAEHIREAVDEIVDAENMATFGSPKSKEAA